MPSVTKPDLVRKVAEKTGQSAKDSEAVVNAVLDSVRESLEAGDEVRLVGFGVFAARESAERQGVNPKTREKITVPAQMRVRFSPGKLLNDAVAKPVAPAKAAPAPAKDKKATSGKK